MEFRATYHSGRVKCKGRGTHRRLARGLEMWLSVSSQLKLLGCYLSLHPSPAHPEKNSLVTLGQISLVSMYFLSKLCDLHVYKKYNTLITFAGTPKMSTHFKPFSTRGRSIPSSLFTPYLSRWDKDKMYLNALKSFWHPINKTPLHILISWEIMHVSWPYQYDKTLCTYSLCISFMSTVYDNIVGRQKRQRINGFSSYQG